MTSAMTRRPRHWPCWKGQLADQAEPAAPPEFFWMPHSGKGDLAARSDEILRAEFGRR